MDEINFDNMLTCQEVVRTFTLENQGRRPQEVKWPPVKPKLQNAAGAVLTYPLTPDICMIRPMRQVGYTRTACCRAPCRFELTPVCCVTVGRTKMELFRPRVHGVFLKPRLIFRSPSMPFHHVHDLAAEEAISGKLMGNTAVPPAQSLLLLCVCVTTEPPFSISFTDFLLEPGETKEFSNASFFPCRLEVDRLHVIDHPLI
jgi:hypothetical protein